MFTVTTGLKNKLNVFLDTSETDVYTFELFSFISQ